jgi:palmitoyltransferase
MQPDGARTDGTDASHADHDHDHDHTDERTKDKATKKRRHRSLADMVADAHERSEARRARKQPWLARKFSIALAGGMMGYTLYVVVGRACVPAIRGERRALAGLPVGGASFGLVLRSTHVLNGAAVGLLATCCVLWIMMVWSYVKVRQFSPLV